MKAAQFSRFGGPEVLEIVELPDPVLLRAHPTGVDLALDIAGSGVLPDLIELARGSEHVITIADFAGAQRYGVRFSSGEDGRAFDALVEVGVLIESGQFAIHIGQTFGLTDLAEAHRVGEAGRVRGKLVLLVGQ